MSRFVGVKYRTVKRIMTDCGWSIIRKRGSHEVWAKGTERITLANRPDGVNQMIVRREFKAHGIFPIPK